MCMLEREPHHESVFQKPLKQLQFVSAMIESVSAEHRYIETGSKAILKN